MVFLPTESRTISGLAVIFPGFLLGPGGPYHTKLLTDAVLGQRVATSFSKGADFAPGFFLGGGPHPGRDLAI